MVCLFVLASSPVVIVFLFVYFNRAMVCLNLAELKFLCPFPRPHTSIRIELDETSKWEVERAAGTESEKGGVTLGAKEGGDKWQNVTKSGMSTPRKVHFWGSSTALFSVAFFFPQSCY